MAICAAVALTGAVSAGQKNPVKRTENNAKAVAEKKQKANASETQPAERVVLDGGIVVFVDPVTRQVRQATPADIATLSPAPASVIQPGQAPPPTMIQGPGGAVGVVLGPEFQIQMTAARTPEGGLKVDEVSGEKAAEKRAPGSTQSGDGK